MPFVLWDKNLDEELQCNGFGTGCFVNAKKHRSDPCGRCSRSCYDMQGTAAWPDWMKYPNIKNKYGTRCPRCHFLDPANHCAGNLCVALRAAMNQDITWIGNSGQAHPLGFWRDLPPLHSAQGPWAAPAPAPAAAATAPTAAA